MVCLARTFVAELQLDQARPSLLASPCCREQQKPNHDDQPPSSSHRPVNLQNRFTKFSIHLPTNSNSTFMPSTAASLTRSNSGRSTEVSMCLLLAQAALTIFSTAGLCHWMTWQWSCSTKQTEWRTWVSWNPFAKSSTNARKTGKPFFSALRLMMKWQTSSVTIKPTQSPLKSVLRKSAWRA